MLFASFTKFALLASLASSALALPTTRAEEGDLSLDKRHYKKTTKLSGALGTCKSSIDKRKTDLTVKLGVLSNPSAHAVAAIVVPCVNVSFSFSNTSLCSVRAPHTRYERADLCFRARRESSPTCASPPVPSPLAKPRLRSTSTSKLALLSSLVSSPASSAVLGPFSSCWPNSLSSPRFSSPFSLLSNVVELSISLGFVTAKD